MGIWNRIERRLWTGDPVRDHGVISDTSTNGTRRKVAVMLAGKREPRVIIRVSDVRWFAGSVDFIDLDRAAATELQAALEDALARM